MSSRAVIDRFSLLDHLLPHCDDSRVALLYPKGEEGLSPGWVKRREDVERAIQSYRDGTLAEQVFGSVTQKGVKYQITRAERLGLVPHRGGMVSAFCVDLDDHSGDGGTVGLLSAVVRFLGARPITFTSQSGTGKHLFFFLQTPIPVAEFVKWAKVWGFNRRGQIEVFPKTTKLTQFWLPNGPNDKGGDTYECGDFESCNVEKLPSAPSARLTNATLDFLRGFVSPGNRNESLNKAAHELGSKNVPRAEAWRLCQRGAELCGLFAEESQQTETTFDSGFAAGSEGQTCEPDEHLPTVLLPGGSVTINEAASKLGRLLANTERFYFRGGALVTLENARRQRTQLKTVKPAALASQFESVAALRKLKTTKEGEIDVPTVCSEQQAKLITNAEPFVAELPSINLISPCPVLVERDGKLVAVHGYDAESGILADGGPASVMTLEEARELILEMLCDFRFATPADHSRAVAAVITPGLVFGRLLAARAPIDLGEANQSQAGKGYRNKLTAAIYGQQVSTVTQKKGGVGSMEETFNSRLIKGHNFISLDNVRGRIDSPAIESFLTEDTYSARIPYEQNVEIDPRRVVVQITSNKAELTPDLANRSACVRMLKQREDHPYRRYPEGDILDHVRANQPLYLGAVFAVIRAWHEAGRPQTEENRHDFRKWARTLDWIVQNLFGLAPIMDGHLETKTRMTTPSLNWLRDVANVVRRNNRMEEPLRAYQIIDLVADEGDIELPGLGETDDLADNATHTKVLQAVGRRLAACFKAKNEIRLDDIVVVRDVAYESGSRHDTKTYQFSSAPIAGRGA